MVINMECLIGMRMMLADNSIDAVVTDPPYGLSKQPDMNEVLRHWLNGDDYVHTGNGFMGKYWDSFVPGPSIWKEVFRVLKPGGHLLAFFGTRTYDLGTLAIRLAGFEIRDQIDWVYGSGFPKSLDVSKAMGDEQWQGWGTALKPAHEPICVARKPLVGTVSENILQFGTGGMNIDG
ncbi:site-specific DNA-methyltransferase, partial [Salmonella enterica subsp. enterica serovar Anatum]|nr:site-specific DNA-methyltransferase [Salmonella enterica subsp. enterica serovar Anatum]